MASISHSMSRCRPCTFPWKSRITTPLPSRQLSASARLRVLSPESPRWIEIPEPAQAPAKRPGPVKGILPVPKKVVTPKTAYKISEEFLDKSAKNPVEEKWITPDQEGAGLKVWQAKMAKARRQHIREGTRLLYRRDQVQRERDEFFKEREERKIEAARSAPERVVDEYTEQSVSDAVRFVLESNQLASREPEAERQARQAQYEAVLQDKERIRRDQLHQLYMKARDFIVTEDQLNEEIETVFGSDDKPVQWPGGRISVWGVRKPRSTAELSGVATESATQERQSQVLKQRMYKIAGELTGGEIEIPSHIQQQQRDLEE